MQFFKLVFRFYAGHLQQPGHAVSCTLDARYVWYVILICAVFVGRCGHDCSVDALENVVIGWENGLNMYFECLVEPSTGCFSSAISLIFS
jgi:hypothetical protein